jgi:dUTP pyrophosphatase
MYNKCFTDFDDLIFTKTKDVKSPERGHETDAGIDFFVPNDFETVVLEQGKDVSIDLGVRVIVPKYFMLIFENKSGVSTKNKLERGACVVDTDYRGVVHAHVFNYSPEPREIHAGDKIIQGIVSPISLCQPKEISNEEYEKYCNTERGEGGFGSTGTK